ncbi:MAG TPA: YihY/virulence factor BrkB family protein [Rhodothermales bacterium]
MARSASPAAHVLQGAKYYLGGVYRQASVKPIFLWAQAIAFKVLITVVPLVFLAVAILGKVLRYPAPWETVSRYVSDFLPGYRSQQLIDALYQLQQAGNALTVIGILGTLFFAMSLFTTLRVVVSSVFQEEWHDQRSILGGYLFDLRMAGQVGLLFLLTIALTSILQTLNSLQFYTTIDILGRVKLDFVWFQEGLRRTITIALYLIPFALSIAMFFQLFLFIPLPHPPARSAFVGAVTTAVLWEVAKVGFTIYATRAGRFDYATPDLQAGGDAAGSALVGLGATFGLILAFVFWVYYSGVVLCIGAIIALQHEKRHRSKIKRKQAADMQSTPALAEPEGKGA